MSVNIIFPTQGDSLNGAAWQFQRLQVPFAGNGVRSGLVVTRTNAAEVAISSGYVIDHLVAAEVLATSIAAIPTATVGMHRYDMIVYNCVTNALARVAGTEATPTGPYSTPSNWFLENKLPLPPQLSSLDMIPLAILCIDSTGIKNITLGQYCVGGVADVRISWPFAIGPSIDLTDDTIEVTIGHVQGTDQTLDDGGANEVAVADIKDAADKRHSQNTDTSLDLGGSNPVTAAQLKGNIIVASQKNYYHRDQNWQKKSTPNTTLQTPNQMLVEINGSGYVLIAQADLDLTSEATWDQVGTDYRVAATRAGKDFYIYACVPVSGTSPTIKISANATNPMGYTTSSSRKVGGFHCLCATVGTIAGHTLTGYLEGDILPASVWDLDHRPICSPEGMVYSDLLHLWVDIYLASGIGASAASAYAATIRDSRNWMDFTDDGAAVKKRLPFDREFQILAAGSNENANIAGSADPVTTGGHTCHELMTLDVAPSGAGWSVGDYVIGASSTKQCKIAQVLSTTTYIVTNRTGTFTLGEILNNSELLTLNVAPATPGWQIGDTITGASSGKTCVIVEVLSSLTYAVKLRNGDFTLGEILSNGAIAADQGASNPTCTTTIAADQGASNPTVAADYAHGGRMISNIGCEDCCGVEWQWLQDQGHRVDGADYTAAIGFTWKNVLGGTKGQFFGQGTYGDVKLRAGGSWSDGAGCGSRSRGAFSYRWSAYSSIGARFVAPPA